MNDPLSLRMAAMRLQPRSATRRATGLLLAGLLALMPPAWGQVWVPNESLVSSQKDLLDPEYNQARAQFTWSDADGKLWVGNIDRDTGMFYPPDGKAVLVDPDTMTADDVLKTLNGPEWVFSTGGDGIAYTKFAGRRHTTANARLGYARPLPDGNWSVGFLGPDVTRRAPYGSETAGDPKPRITYVDGDNNHYWREIDDPSTEELLPDTPSRVGPVRHVRGARAVIYTTPVAGMTQVFYRDLDSGQVTQLTSDAGAKDQPYMWMAPEFGGEFVFMTMVENNQLRIYRNLPQPGTGVMVWTPIYSAIAPRRDSFTSPEPFTFQGRSYVFMAMIVGNHGFSSELWISNIDASNPLFRRISDNAVLRARTDPEVFATNHGVFIYYNRRLLDTSGRKPKACPGVPCSEGIYRADTGLGS